MIELVFITCLAGQPEACTEHANQFLGDNLVRCNVEAQPWLANWAGDHPGQWITHWECRLPTAEDEA